VTCGVFKPTGRTHMDRQQTYATTWRPMVDHEPIRIVPDHDGNPLRGLLIGLAISAALWATLGGGIWFVLPLAA
jgi:hypothetical protein